MSDKKFIYFCHFEMDHVLQDKIKEDNMYRKMMHHELLTSCAATGICRKKAPIAHSTEGYAIWPIVRMQDHCDEFHQEWDSPIYF